MSQYVECPVCNRGFYFDAEEEGDYETECGNEECSVPLAVHAALVMELWVTEEDAAPGDAAE